MTTKLDATTIRLLKSGILTEMETGDHAPITFMALKALVGTLHAAERGGTVDGDVIATALHCWDMNWDVKTSAMDDDDRKDIRRKLHQLTHTHQGTNSINWPNRFYVA